MSDHYIYIMASKRNGTLYIGNTTDLVKRVWQHKNKYFGGFTAKYDVNILVYYEHYNDYWDAAQREKNMKEWKRIWKLNLIEKDNPDWNDLYDEICGLDPGLRRDAKEVGC